MAAHLPRLKDFDILTRVGVTALVATLIGGYIFSGLHLKNHHEMRDDRPGLTMTDVQGAYHGVVAPSPLLDALQSGHPADLPDADRDALIEWLSGDSDSVRSDYDNFDLEIMPEDVIATACISCHSRTASGPDAYPEQPFDYPDDVFEIAFSREIQPTNDRIRVMSIHAHAPTMAMVLLVIGGLGTMTRFPTLITGGLLAIGGLGLAGDIAGQYWSKDSIALVGLIVAGGFAYVACTCVIAAAVMIDCWLPGGRSTSSADAAAES